MRSRHSGPLPSLLGTVDLYCLQQQPSEPQPRQDAVRPREWLAGALVSAVPALGEDIAGCLPCSFPAGLCAVTVFAALERMRVLSLSS